MVEQHDFFDTLTNKELQIVNQAINQLIMLILLDAEGQILRVNNMFCDTLNYSFDELMEQDYKVLHSGCHTEIFYREIIEKVSTGQNWTGEISIKGGRGEVFWVNANIYPLLDESGTPYQYLLFLTDVTKALNAEKWKSMALHDELTGLSNRRRLNLAFNSSILLANDKKLKFAVLFMDINHFKYINDSYGHLVGDKLLKKIGSRLRTLFPNKDCVFRFGGDEFVILLEDIEKLEEVAESIIDLFKKPFVIDSHRFHASTRIGISIYPEHSIYQDQLMKFADSAMLYAKKHSKSYQIYFFSMENSE